MPSTHLDRIPVAPRPRGGVVALIVAAFSVLAISVGPQPSGHAEGLRGYVISVGDALAAAE